MKAFFAIFLLQLRALVRARVAALLALASVGWLFALPHVLKGDGTAEGLREVYLHYALGGVFLLVVLSLVAAATGALAQDRAAKRLQLTLIRPVRPAVIAFARYAAIVSLGAAVLALAAALMPMGLRVALSPFGPEAVRGAFGPCSHVIKPVLSSPREEALKAYDAFMASPETPDEAKRASKTVVLRLLESRALDECQTIETNAVLRWTFPDEAREAAGLAVRLRFTNRFQLRQDVQGVFRFGEATGVVSNISQAVLTVPLAGRPGLGEPVLSFENRGKTAQMLRPRRDLDLLVPADGFGWNLLRAWVELVAVLALLVAFGVFLGAGLGRPVALFVALVTLTVSEMGPAVIEQYPDALETTVADRIGLALTRVAAELTHPVSALTPLEHLAKDECVEPREVARAVGVDVVVVPLLFALLAAFVMPRKEET